MADCPTPGKKRFPVEVYAIKAALGASMNYGKPMRHYRCPCGAWHITKAVRPVDSGRGSLRLPPTPAPPA